MRLHEALPETGASMVYTYDFGDGWQHEVTAEALLDPQSGAALLDGSGACPPPPRTRCSCIRWPSASAGC